MKTLYFDTETFSATPITSGTHRYAETSEILLVPFAWNDGEPTVWDLTTGEKTLADVQGLIDEADEVVIHNSAFDRTVARWNGVDIPLAKITDTMVIALQHSLPGGLGDVGEVLGVPSDKAKDKAGKKLIQLFTKPRPKNMKLRRATRETHPAEWEAFKAYAASDITAMREVHKRLPIWNCTDAERRLWQLDQIINDRGVAIDLDLAHAALRAAERTGKRLAAKVADLTGGAVASATQRDKFRDHLAEAHGFTMADMTKGSVNAALKDDTLDDDVRELLETRQQASATSPAKYKVLVKATSSDGRLRGTLQFCGASRTGRWGGRLFQPQNLPRPTLDQPDIDFGIDAMKLDCEDLFYDNVMELCASSVRGTLVAPPGRKLVISDLSNIEGRVLAWLAGEQWKLKAFRDFDAGIGHDLYKITAASILGKKPENITRDERQVSGKVPELACGYQGSVGAFATMGALYGVNLPEDEVLAIVKAWRRAHRATVNFWYDVEKAARHAILNPRERFDVRALAFGYANNWLRIRLPSGRYLCYPYAAVGDFCWDCNGTCSTPQGNACATCEGTGREGSKLHYHGVDQYTRKWKELDTYGGKLCIAQDTPVLTDSGWLPIQNVTTAHRVWDGVDWVTHAGLANNGRMGVIRAHGVWMTPDHEVLTTEGWQRASQSERFDRAACRLPDGYELRRERRAEIAVAGGLRLRSDGDATGGRVAETSEARGASLLRLPPEHEYRRAPHDARHVETQSLRGMAQHERPLPSTDARGVGAIWRTWHNGLRALAGVLRGVLGGHGADLRGRPDAGQDGQQRWLLAGKLPLGVAETAGAEHARERIDGHAVGPNDGGRSCRAVGPERDDAALPVAHRGVGGALVQPAGHYAQVYDLVNCGPRRRFVVMGVDGLPLIVHNCENIVQATARDVLAFGMFAAEDAGYQTVLSVHDELITETPDSDEFNASGLEAIMATNPSWAVGLPLAAGGFETYRYRKD